MSIALIFIRSKALSEGASKSGFLQKYYPEKEIHSALAKHGFASIEALSYDSENRLTNVIQESKRAFFLCQK